MVKSKHKIVVILNLRVTTGNETFKLEDSVADDDRPVKFFDGIVHRPLLDPAGHGALQ